MTPTFAIREINYLRKSQSDPEHTIEFKAAEPAPGNSFHLTGSGVDSIQNVLGYYTPWHPKEPSVKCLFVLCRENNKIALRQFGLPEDDGPAKHMKKWSMDNLSRVCSFDEPIADMFKYDNGQVMSYGIVFMEKEGYDAQPRLWWYRFGEEHSIEIQVNWGIVDPATIKGLSVSMLADQCLGIYLYAEDAIYFVQMSSLHIHSNFHGATIPKPLDSNSLYAGPRNPDGPFELVHVLTKWESAFWGYEGKCVGLTSISKSVYDDTCSRSFIGNYLFPMIRKGGTVTLYGINLGALHENRKASAIHTFTVEGGQSASIPITANPLDGMIYLSMPEDIAGSDEPRIQRINPSTSIQYRMRPHWDSSIDPSGKLLLPNNTILVPADPKKATVTIGKKVVELQQQRQACSSLGVNIYTFRARTTTPIGKLTEWVEVTREDGGKLWWAGMDASGQEKILLRMTIWVEDESIHQQDQAAFGFVEDGGGGGSVIVTCLDIDPGSIN